MDQVLVYLNSQLSDCQIRVAGYVPDLQDPPIWTPSIIASGAPARPSMHTKDRQRNAVRRRVFGVVDDSPKGTDTLFSTEMWV